MRSVLGNQPESLHNVQRWLALVGARPAVQRGMALPKVG
jgi:GST-like protein